MLNKWMAHACVLKRKVHGIVDFRLTSLSLQDKKSAHDLQHTYFGANAIELNGPTSTMAMTFYSTK